MILGAYIPIGTKVIYGVLSYTVCGVKEQKGLVRTFYRYDLTRINRYGVEVSVKGVGRDSIKIVDSN